MSKNIRVIAKLDIKGPNLIKGIQFEGYRVIGLAQEFAQKYYLEGIDELIYHDAVASLYRRNGLLEIIKKTAQNIFIPLTVAGGIRSIEDIKSILRAGADKVAINTAAVHNPNLIKEASKIFGAQCIVSSIEYFYYEDKYQVWTDYGREVTLLDALDWAKQVVDLGAGEILLSCINRDGMGQGFDLEFADKLSNKVPVPVIISSGAGNAKDILKVAYINGVDAVCLSSIFHYFYAKPVTTTTMTFEERRLRMGEFIDAGNVDFLKDGYGGLRAIMVEPCSIMEVKSILSKNNFRVRKITNTASGTHGGIFCE